MFTHIGWEDDTHWLFADRATFKRIIHLIADWPSQDRETPPGFGGCDILWAVASTGGARGEAS